jgi:O-antigen/teichoic acid export membrane protein
MVTGSGPEGPAGGLRPPSGGADPRHAVGFTVTRNALWNLAYTVVSVPVSLLMVPVLLAGLGEAGYGAWVLASTFLGLSSLLQLGMLTAITKLVAEHAARGEQGEVNRVVSTGTALLVAIALLAAGIAIGAHDAIARALFPAAAARSAAFAPMLAATLTVFLVQHPLVAYQLVLAGLQRQELVQAVNLTNLVVFSAGAVLLVRRGAGPVELMWWLAATAAASVLAFLVLAHRAYRGLALGPALAGPRALSRLLSFGLRVYVASVAGPVHLAVDKVVLSSRIVGRYDLVGLYGIALTVVQKLVIVPHVMMGPLMAAASELSARREADALRGLYRRAQRYNWILASILFGGVLVAGGPLVRVWLGGDYPFVVRTLHVLALGFFAITLSIPALQLLNGIGHPEVGLSAGLAGAAVNVAASVAVARAVGPADLPIATSSSLVIEAAWLLAAFHRTTGYPIRETLVPEVLRILAVALAAGAIAAPVAAPASRGDWPPLIAGAMLYVVLTAAGFVATGALDARDLQSARMLAARLRGAASASPDRPASPADR